MKPAAEIGRASPDTFTTAFIGCRLAFRNILIYGKFESSCKLPSF
jgi:hypothetical protein